MFPRGRAYGYSPGRNGPDVPIMPPFNGGVPSAYDIGGLPSRNAAMPHPIAADTMTSTLANATPDQQRMVCFHFLLTFWAGCSFSLKVLVHLV